MRAGATAALYARVTDDGPELQATVSGTLNGDSLVFADDGNAPDESAGDGVYSAEIAVPSDSLVLEAVFEVGAEALGKSPASARMVVPITHAPANDHFNERAGLSGRRVVLADYTNRGASTEEGERRHYYVRPQKNRVVYLDSSAQWSSRSVVARKRLRYRARRVSGQFLKLAPTCRAQR